MPPKQDINRSGWESTDMPSVCERCLPDNPYVQMLKEEYGAACKICTRPFTIFRWKADRTARQKTTGICLTCARLKNCCQCCMLDLSFGLPIVVRDAALKMIAPGPTSSINREFYAQENQKAIEDGKGGVEAYEQTDEKARDLLRRLANSEPYYKKQRRLEAEEAEAGDGQKLLQDQGEATGSSSYRQTGAIRTSESRPRHQQGDRGDHTSRSGSKRHAPSFSNTAPPRPEDINPPADPHVKSLFITGVEDDLPEHEIKRHFQEFGQLRSVVCSHRSHCAFLNYMTREGAEAAALTCQGRAVVKGVPLRVQWGKPKPLDSLDTETRMANARAGRDTAAAVKRASGPRSDTAQGSGTGSSAPIVAAPPPGADDVQYASLKGD